MDSQLLRGTRQGKGGVRQQGGKRYVPQPKIDTVQLVAFFQAGRYGEVETMARSLLGKYPLSGFLWKALGAALQIQGKDALHALRQASTILTDDAEAHSNLAGALCDAGQPDAALKSSRRALMLKPGLADALCNQGIALLNLGRLDEAVASLQRALKTNPRHALALNNLGNALQGQKRLQEAADCYRQALAIMPHYAEAYNNLGKALYNLQLPQEALASYRRAVEIKPDFHEAWCNLAVVLQETGQFDAAIESFHCAIRIAPDRAEAHFNLGRVQRLLGRTAEAQVSCDKALAINPRLVEALVLSGEFCADNGDFDLAEAVYRRAIEIEPQAASAWAGIPRVRKMSRDDDLWLGTVQKLVEQDLVPREEAGLRYALGKYFDDVGEFGMAFTHYQRGNELDRQCRESYNAADEDEQTARIARTCRPEWFAGKRQGANASQRPVFIVGMPRSGTSLAEQILASHPMVYGAGELPFWQAAPARDALLKDGAAGDIAVSALAPDYLQLLDSINLDALRVIDKMPVNYRHVGLIHAAFPNARFIHMQRNPVDTCLSIYFQRFNVTHTYSNDLADLAHCYAAYRRLMAHWRAILPAHALLEVPYESLVDDQEGWSRKMVEFLDLRWDQRCLDFPHSTRMVTTLSNWQVRQKISKASVERWRHYAEHLGALMPLLELDGLSADQDYR